MAKAGAALKLRVRIIIQISHVGSRDPSTGTITTVSQGKPARKPQGVRPQCSLVTESPGQSDGGSPFIEHKLQAYKDYGRGVLEGIFGQSGIHQRHCNWPEGTSIPPRPSSRVRGRVLQTRLETVPQVTNR